MQSELGMVGKKIWNIAGLAALLVVVAAASAGCADTGPPTHNQERAADVALIEMYALAANEGSQTKAAERNPVAMSTGIAFGFEPYVAYPIGDWRDSTNGRPDTTAIGDVTGDGRDDVIMVTLGSSVVPMQIDHKVFIYAQLADGSLQAPVLHSYADGLYTAVNNFPFSGVTLADLNQDGIKDIVVGYGRGIAIFVSLGAGSFAVSKHIDPGTGLNSLNPTFVKNVVATDIDRDGRLDVVTHNFPSGGAIFYGDGRGGVDAIESFNTPATNISDVKVGDVNSDGFDDLVVLSGDRHTHKFWFMLNTGVRGAGTAQVHTLPGDETHRGLAIGDWNGDGRNDVAISVYKNQSVYGFPAGLLVFDQTSPGQFADPRSVPGLDLPLAMISRDFDGDGLDDLLVEHHGWGKVGLYLQSNGTLAAESLFGTPSASGFNPQAFSAGDVNGDGCTDVAMADINFGLVILRGKNCQRAPTLPDESGFKELWLDP